MVQQGEAKTVTDADVMRSASRSLTEGKVDLGGVGAPIAAWLDFMAERDEFWRAKGGASATLREFSDSYHAVTIALAVIADRKQAR